MEISSASLDKRIRRPSPQPHAAPGTTVESFAAAVLRNQACPVSHPIQFGICREPQRPSPLPCNRFVLSLIVLRVSPPSMANIIFRGTSAKPRLNQLGLEMRGGVS